MEKNNKKVVRSKKTVKRHRITLARYIEYLNDVQRLEVDEEALVKIIIAYHKFCEELTRKYEFDVDPKIIVLRLFSDYGNLKNGRLPLDDISIPKKYDYLIKELMGDDTDKNE